MKQNSKKKCFLESSIKFIDYFYYNVIHLINKSKDFCIEECKILIQDCNYILYKTSLIENKSLLILDIENSINIILNILELYRIRHSKIKIRINEYIYSLN